MKILHDCGATVDVPGALAGMTIRCPRCLEKIAVPGGDGRPASPGRPPEPQETLLSSSCPRCGSPVVPGRPSCERCGLPVGTSSAPVVVEAASGTQAHTRCPRCGLILVGRHQRCKGCGYDLTQPEGAGLDDGRPGLRDFLTGFWHGDVLINVAMMVAGTIVSIVAALAGGVTLGAGAYLLAGITKSPLVTFIGAGAAQVALLFWCAGFQVKSCFAACEAKCRGIRETRDGHWTAARAGKGLFVLCVAGAVLSLPPAAAVWLLTGNPALGAAAFAPAVLIYFLMGFLSYAESGGDAAGLNPLRVLAWIVQVPFQYLGVAALVVLDYVVVMGLGVALLALVAWALGRMETSGTACAVDARWLVLAGAAFVVVNLLQMHPAALMAHETGLLFRRNAERLA